MNIRCERCSTLYELDEALLAPEGSSVQCTRCDHVFTARPPAQSEGQGAPLAVAEVRARDDVAAAPPPSRDEPEDVPPSPPRAPLAEGAGTREPRTARASTPSVYRPTPGPGAGVRAHPVLRRDTVGAFESRLRWSARLRWLVPAIAVGALLVSAAGWLLLRGRVDPGAASAQAEALALLALDDEGSLERAVARLDDALRLEPGLRSAAADRALVQVAQASALRERSQAVAAEHAAGQAERERVLREQAPGWEAAERAMAAKAAALDSESVALEQRARALVASAREALGPLATELKDASAVVRARAAMHAAAGERDEALALASAGGSPGERDPWLDLVDAAVDAADAQRPAQERAAVKLAALTARTPALLRARQLLARVQAALGRPEEAGATLDRLLAANPRHEGARAVRAALSARAAAAGALAPEGNLSPLPRKPIAQRAPGTVPGAPASGSTTAAAPVPDPAGAGGGASAVGGAASAPVGTAASTSRGPAQSGLAPASIPEVAPASAMPQIAPPEVPESGRRPSREPAVYDEPIGGG
ncbi:zinc-ribbon domain-containing protein [Anaeromyxobacter sp. Fw109-5]|uniref:zinc-ribbon domain-containing protein n=1 Tax=Anaeromyxobacter sp. (strain Fw109-5) TaxID=404589 RepID=UPI000158A576|nr:zinc-ribbon domain-containing protein [Anaeromyxobacter sp. Fw109-5]ABS26218.1 MJ0042 family finger-like protein [Anaeromyxobacter sp. Fw109-5]